MKLFNTCLWILLFLGSTCGSAQTLTQLGFAFEHDDPRDLLHSADGGFITTGIKSSKGVLYKTDCGGNILAQITKGLAQYTVEFFGATELPDGSIVAAGYASLVQTASDTLDHLVLLKTDAGLDEVAFVHYALSGKHTRAKSLTTAPDGTLLVLGDLSGTSVNFWDMFFLRVNPVTLQPAAQPVIYHFGVDNAKQIVPAENNTYLLSCSSLIGNIFVPESLINNRLVTVKVTELGEPLWQYIYEKTARAKFGFCRSGGSVRHPATGSIISAGAIYTNAPDSLSDPVFILLNDQGEALDTITEVIPGRQNLYNTIANQGDAGAWISLGETTHPNTPPTLLLANPKALNNQFVYAFFGNDTLTPVSLRDIVEISGNRFAFAGALPDNVFNQNVTNIIVATPQIDNIEILYQNCALVASFSAPDPVYQWYFNGEAIPGANTGVYFPDQPGVYQVAVGDNIGCVGASDTLNVVFATAGFSSTASNGTYSFINTSTGANSYLWNFGDGTTSTAANPVHTYTTAATYPVTLIAFGPCGSDTLTNMLVDAPEPALISTFRVFPNPNDGHFTVEISGTARETVILSLYNSVGQLVERREAGFQSGILQQIFHVDNPPPGVYSLQLQSAGTTRQLKVVIR
ncbi:MAG: T9SS type A sorting domain-containing protein [Lewinellaceae bacterium]|nr:T9SS type A sorting domain-containing protein [Lewinellaceae bacterium]